MLGDLLASRQQGASPPKSSCARAPVLLGQRERIQGSRPGVSWGMGMPTRARAYLSVPADCRHVGLRPGICRGYDFSGKGGNPCFIVCISHFLKLPATKLKHLNAVKTNSLLDHWLVTSVLVTNKVSGVSDHRQLGSLVGRH